MLAVTVGGQSGAGGEDIGRLIATEISAIYVQKKAIRRLARHLGASVEAVVRKEMAYASRWKRLGHMVELWLSQMGRTGSEPWAMPMMTTGAYYRMPDRKELPGEISDDEYRDGVFAVAHQFAGEGNIVLTHRAGCLTLENSPAAVHVGLFASRDARVARIARRYRLGYLEASDWLESMDRARAAWFKQLAGAHPHDPDLYDISVDATRFMDDGMAAESIARAVVEVHEDSPLIGAQPAMA